MTWTDLMLRLRALLSPRRVERELNEELAFHLDREVERLVQGGLSRQEARLKAHARFGSVTVAADQCRDQRGTGVIDATIRDVHYAVRSFRRTPLASATIVATVALGLGLVAAVFSFFNALMFDADSVRDPHQLVEVQRRHPGSNELVPFTRAEYDALQRETGVFVNSVAWTFVGAGVEGRAMLGKLVSGNFFQSLGVGPEIGRVLTPDDENAGAPVMVLSHHAWTQWFAGDPSVVGRRVRLNGATFEIVGVARQGFRGLSIGPPGFWAPLSQLGHFHRAPEAGGSEADITIVGRLAPDTPSAVAASKLNVWATAAARRGGAEQAEPSIRLQPRQGTVGDEADKVMVAFAPLFFSFGLVLLIGCANASNLLLARGLARQRELGIRLSIGASRSRIVRQLLVESLLLALVAAGLGLLVSRIILSAIVYTVATAIPPDLLILDIPIPDLDWRVILFQLAAAIGATAFFGLVPALHSTRLELVRTMRGEVARDARPRRARGALIATQVAASALLLISAAVFLRSAMAIAARETGIRTSDTMAVEIETESQRPAVVRAIAEHPRVAAIAGARPHALEPPREGHATSAGADAGTRRRGVVGYRYVSADYFSVLDIRLLQGRPFTTAEREVEAGVTIVSASAARELWPDGSAIGQTVMLELGPKAWETAPDEAPIPARPFTVIGVADDVRHARLLDHPLATVYLPTHEFAARTSVIVRGRGDPDQVRAQLLVQLAPIDPDLEEIRTFEAITGIETFVLGIAFRITIALAIFALVLTLSGLFSVLSYVVEQRTKEIGVRMALGASPDSVKRLMVLDLVNQVALGLIVGTGLALAVAIVLRATAVAEFISEVVQLLDPVAYVASGVCILSACWVAAWIPARRAARIDPIATLRQD